MKRIFSFCLIVSLLVSLVSCGGYSQKQDENKNAFISFEDSMGRKVSLDAKPQKVAVLFSSFAQIWTLAGGVVDISVYESVERGFASEEAVLVDGGAGKSINTELLIAASPDFVIASADVPAQVECMDLLESSGIPCAYFRVESFSDYLYMLRVCTNVTGNKSAYEEYGIKVKEEVSAVLSKADSTEAGKKILFIRAGSTKSSTKAKNAENNFVCAMLKELGCNNVADNAKILLDSLSEEEILLQDPDVLFVSTMGDEDAAIANVEQMLASGVWSEISAVKNGRVYYLPKDMFQYKPNQNWGKAYAYLYEIINNEN